MLDLFGILAGEPKAIDAGSRTRAGRASRAAGHLHNASIPTVTPASVTTRGDCGADFGFAALGPEEF